MKDIYKNITKKKVVKIEKPLVKKMVEMPLTVKLEHPETQKVEVTNQQEQLPVVFPETQKVEVINQPEPIVIPEETTIKNTDELAEKITNNL